MTPVIDRVRKLLSLATGAGTSEHEARTAAFHAARLIVEHGLIGAAPRDRPQLQDIAQELTDELVRAAWEVRRDRDAYVQIGDVITIAVEQGVITEAERKVVREMIWGKARYLRMKGVLVGRQGPNGGFQIAPNVRRRKVA